MDTNTSEGDNSTLRIAVDVSRGLHEVLRHEEELGLIVQHGDSPAQSHGRGNVALASRAGETRAVWDEETGGRVLSTEEH